MPKVTVLGWVTQYGYLGVFGSMALGILGLPIPDELVLTFSGYLIFKGDMRFAFAATSAFAGAMCGITLSYYLGRTIGVALLAKHGKLLRLSPGRISHIQHWFTRTGKWVLIFGYFLPGLRHLTAFTAGSSGLRYLTFAFFAYTGALLWATSFISVGYYLGKEWYRTSDKIHYIAVLISILAGGAWLLFVFWVSRRRKKT